MNSVEMTTLESGARGGNSISGSMSGSGSSGRVSGPGRARTNIGRKLHLVDLNGKLWNL